MSTKQSEIQPSAVVLATIQVELALVFKAVLVELDGTDRAKDELARKLLREAGMRKAETLKVINSELYLREGVVEKPPLVTPADKPPYPRRGACSQS